MEVASSSGADHFDMVAFPVHLVAGDGARRCLCDGVEIGDGEPKGRICVDRATQRRHRLGPIHGLLRLAIKGGGLHGGGDDPAMVLDGGSYGEGLAGTVVDLVA